MSTAAPSRAGAGRVSPAAVTWLVQAMIASGALAVLGMWLKHTPPQLPSSGDVAVAVARLTGLLAGYAALVMVALMARIPLIERNVGTDRLARWHSSGGRYTVLLVVAHVASAVWGYARTARVPIGREINILLRDYPYVLLAVIAAAILVLVGIVSVRAARRAAGYELWYYLHLLTYLALALAVGHQLAVGSDFIHYSLDRYAWIALYAVVAVLVTYFRLLRPAVVALRSRVVVSRVVAESSGLVSITVEGADQPASAAESGQFFRLRFLARRLWWQSHPFSLSAPPGEGILRFTIKPVGDHTSALQHVTVGTRVLIDGPFGTLTGRRRQQEKVLLIAGGIGIAPLRALFESMPAAQGDTTLIYRCRSEQDVTFRAELDALARESGATVIYLVGRSAELDRPLDAQNLLRVVPDLALRDVFLCAPAAMMTEVARTLRAIGVPGSNVHQEIFELPTTPVAVGRRAAVASALLLVCLVPVALRARVSSGSRESGTLSAPAPGGLDSARPRPAAAAQITVVGSAQRTLFSTVQVAAVLRNDRLVDVLVLALPDLDARSRQLNAMAAPILRREAITAGSAQIDSVTGATYTSAAYAQSLQAALDQVAGARPPSASTSAVRSGPQPR